MQYAAAVALVSLSGKPPTKDSVTAVLTATGQKFDSAKIDEVLKNLGKREVHDAISKGISKVGASTGGAAPAKQEKKKKEEKKPEPKKEVKKPEPEPEAEEEDFAIDLFG